MKISRLFTSIAGAGIALAFTFVLLSSAQEPPENAPPPPPSIPVEESKDDLRVLGETPAEPETRKAVISIKAEWEGKIAAAQAEQAAAEARSDAGADQDDAAQPRRRFESEMVRFFSKVVVGEGRYVREAVSILGSVLVEQGGEVQQGAVAILGDNVVDGTVGGEAVAVLGDMTVNGRVGSEAVAVLGNTVINGEVMGEVVNVMGNVQLGPEAHLHSDLVSVGGRIDRAPGARVDGDVQEIAFLGNNTYVADGLRTWIRRCLLMGRPLAFGEHLGWAWSLAVGALAFYCFLALLFPKAVVKCTETLEARPGYSIIAAFLSLLLAPILAIVLSVTVVGPVLLGFFLFFAGIFGKVVFFAWFGRRMTLPLGVKAPALAVLAGGFITLFIYVIPVIGFLFQKVAGILGLGVVIYTIILMVQSDRADRPKRAKAQPSSVPPVVPVVASNASPRTAEPMGATAGEAMVPEGAPTPEGPESATDAAVPPPLRSEPRATNADTLQFSTLPRAGFWIRVAATLLDIMLIGVVLNMMETRLFSPADYFPLMAATYFVAFWALKGTTIGGVVCGLKVVRLDDRPVDWSVAVVRGLGGFLSLFIAGLGFIWVAFDDERQSWHDKIAGTTIVRVPRGVSLI